MSKIFVINLKEDPYIEVFESEEDFEKRMEEHGWHDLTEEDAPTFLDGSNPNGVIDIMSTQGILVIRGDAVIPRAESVVTRFKLDRKS